MSKQITITIKVKDNEKEIKLRHPIKDTVLNTLREGGFYLPSLCSSMGKCGRCSVKFLGYAPLPTQTDRVLLTPQKLREGYRLSCLAKPVRDCVLEAAFRQEDAGNILVSSSFDSLDKEENCPEGSQTILAADLGTTTIAMQLLNVCSGKIMDSYTCPNPQSCFGADVIERVRAAGKGKAPELKRLAREAVGKGVEALCASAQKKKLKKPALISIAGNTVMGHLFMGYSTDSLGKSPFKPVNIKMIDFEWKGIRTVLVPGISAFIGGDIMAGLLAMGLQKDEKWLFMDLGTNAEMVIGNGNRMFATAAAAGPAFEGQNCLGSHRIHAAAQLLKQKMIDGTGLLKDPYFETGITVEGVYIGQKDIREIQMAKAAVRTGVHYLKEKSALSGYNCIDKVYLAGGLGFYLDKKAAAGIGLIPKELEDKIESVGNTSLYGAGLYGRKVADGSYDSSSLDDYTGSCEVFNLALEESFQENFIKYMNFD